MKILVNTLAAFCLLAHSYAASIVAAAEQSNGIALPDGVTMLPVGNQFRVGTFLLGGVGGSVMSDSQIAAFAGNPAGLAANFVQFGTGNIGDTFGAGFDGFFSSTMVANSTALGLANAQIYLWFFKTTGNNAPLSNFSNVTHQGVFFVEMGVMPSWRIRPETEIPNSTNVDIADLSNASGTATKPGAHLVIGGFGGNNTIFGKPNYTLAVVPEPSFAALAGIGLAVFGFRRRRS